MEHPLTTTLRWCLLAGLVVWLWPECGLILLGTNCFGWWTGDGCCTTDCSVVCNPAATATVQVDISGVTNLICTCTTMWNKSFVLTQNLAADSSGCRYDVSVYSSSCAVGCLTGGLTFRWTAVPTATLLIQESGVNGGDWTGTVSISNPRDCTSATGLSGITGTEGVSSLCCEYASVSATVTPL